MCNFSHTFFASKDTLEFPSNISNVIPITSYPCFFNNRADTLLSTPPLIPNNTLLFSIYNSQILIFLKTRHVDNLNIKNF